MRLTGVFDGITGSRLNPVFRLRAEGGISLVEVVVAIAVLGVSLAAFASALSTGSIAVGLKGEETIAQRLAQSQLESLKAATYDATGASYTLVTAPADYSVSLAVDSSIYTNNDIQKLTVTIRHDDNTILTAEDYKVNR